MIMNADRSTTSLRRSEIVRLAVAAVFSLAALAIAVLPRNWIELASASEPDGGDGSFELALVLAPLALAAVLVATVVVTRRRVRAAASD